MVSDFLKFPVTLLKRLGPSRHGTGRVRVLGEILDSFRGRFSTQNVRRSSPRVEGGRVTLTLNGDGRDPDTPIPKVGLGRDRTHRRGSVGGLRRGLGEGRRDGGSSVFGIHTRLRPLPEPPTSPNPDGDFVSESLPPRRQTKFPLDLHKRTRLLPSFPVLKVLRGHQPCLYLYALTLSFLPLWSNRIF